MPVVPMLFCAFACIYDNGGQKCWDLSSDITKTSDPSPPTPNKVEFGAKWVKMSAFLATTLLGEVGGRRDEPKAEQKIVLRSRVLRNYCLEALFHTVQSSFVLHCTFEKTIRSHALILFFFSIFKMGMASHETSAFVNRTMS